MVDDEPAPERWGNLIAQTKDGIEAHKAGLRLEINELHGIARRQGMILHEKQQPAHGRKRQHQ